ncbi:MAG: hypothetical protein CM15mP122_5540 [Bacteroidota bacterium]|nr:MAG: hypothetical protein CM15mP122_5540 [Bacteroidota bacterium]
MEPETVTDEATNETITIPLTVADLRGTWEDQPRNSFTPDPRATSNKVCAICTPGV